MATHDVARAKASAMRAASIPIPAAAEAPVALDDVAGAVPTPVYVFDLRGERNVWVNAAIVGLLGYTPEQVAEMNGALTEQIVHPDDLARHYPRRLIALQEMAPDETSRFVYRALHADGRWRHLESLERPFARGEDGRVTQVIGVAFDVTEREAREAASRLLIREMAHRLRNVFAVTGGLVRMAGHGAAAETRAVLRRLGDRLNGLALAHEVIEGVPGARTAGLRAMLTRTLDPYRDGHPIRVCGDDPRLPEAAMLPLGLIVHELATNAVKHGALGRPDGRLHVAVSAPGPGSDVVVSWQELPRGGGGAGDPTSAADGPGDEAPAAAGLSGEGGFGDALIEGAARQLDGTIRRRLVGGFARVELRFPHPG